jgi:hypothetical protein
MGLWVVLLSACQPVSDAWLTGWTETEARDRIMWVRNEPPSLGQRRLTHQTGVYPQLGGFLRTRGMPDFLAESYANDRHYLILYYLTAKRAYICRAKPPQTREIEFSAPYAMTRREYRMLQGFKREAEGPPPAPGSLKRPATPPR